MRVTRAADRHGGRADVRACVEIAVWALLRCWPGSTAKADAFEFAFENYTALGYGDAVAGSGKRLIGPITALNGCC